MVVDFLELLLLLDDQLLLVLQSLFDQHPFEVLLVSLLLLPLFQSWLLLLFEALAHLAGYYVVDLDENLIWQGLQL